MSRIESIRGAIVGISDIGVIREMFLSQVERAERLEAALTELRKWAEHDRFYKSEYEEPALDPKGTMELIDKAMEETKP